MTNQSPSCSFGGAGGKGGGDLGGAGSRKFFSGDRFYAVIGFNELCAERTPRGLARKGLWGLKGDGDNPVPGRGLRRYHPSHRN